MEVRKHEMMHICWVLREKAYVLQRFEKDTVHFDITFKMDNKYKMQS